MSTAAAPARAMRRNVALLSACWAVAMTGAVVLATVAALAGHRLAEDKSLATLPLGLMLVGTAVVTVPASFLMQRIGRRLGIMAGALIGAAGAALCALAVYLGSFALLCVGVFLIGGNNGFNFYLRFAAWEVADDAFRSRAISLVLAGGVVGAIVGPYLARWSAGMIDAGLVYIGPFLAIAALALVILVIIAFAEIPRPAAVASHGRRRLGAIARQPAFVVAVAGGVLAYGAMNLLMVVAPLAMVLRGHAFADAAAVVGWHTVGMFLPSFFTGHLIGRFGVLTVMAAGAVLLLVCAAVALTGATWWHFWATMVLVGAGWNFLFVGATALLAETHGPGERAKTQALNEFLMFSAAAATSFLSGTLHHNFGWETLNLTIVPPTLAMLAATLWLVYHRRRMALRSMAE